MRRHDTRSDPGQALVELALVLPLFAMLLIGIVVLGLGVFYQEQVANAAREAARYAAIHSATAQQPTVGHLDPDSEDPPGVTGSKAAYKPLSYVRFDAVEDGWPHMTAFARSKLAGLDASSVQIAACWSGFRDNNTQAFDAPPPGTYEITAGVSETYATTWHQCSIDGHDPTTNSSAIGCEPGLTTDDEASSMSEKQGVIVANRVTTYACYIWSPPMAGFLLIPEQVTLRAVATEPIERQQ